MRDYQQAFVKLALDIQALRLGSFTLKSGRQSPYFFNAGHFDNGCALQGLCRAFAEALRDPQRGGNMSFDMIFGPAYKGITLAAGLAMELYSETGLKMPFAFNRKEAKAHGEAGTLVGAPLQGRVLIIDDVITAGTSIRESARIIADSGAELAGILIALDRQERGNGELSATQEVCRDYGVPVVSIVDLDTLLAFSGGHAAMTDHYSMLKDYRARWGVPAATLDSTTHLQQGDLP